MINASTTTEDLLASLYSRNCSVDTKCEAYEVLSDRCGVESANRHWALSGNKTLSASEVRAQTNRALVELRRWTFDETKHGKKRLQAIDLVIVPFSYGPRCWRSAIIAAGCVPSRMDPNHDFNNRKSYTSDDRNWTSGYVVPVRGDINKALEMRVESIRKWDAKVVIGTTVRD